VRHRRRVRDEALDAAERLGEREAAKTVEKRLDRGLAAVELESQHRAKAVLLARGKRVPVVRAEPGPEHARHRRMIGKELGDERRILFVSATARREREKAAQR